MRHKALVLLRLTTLICINRILALVYHVPMPRVIRKSLMRKHGMLLMALGGYWRGAWSLAAGVDDTEVLRVLLDAVRDVGEYYNRLIAAP
jgi:hypothetical protein